MLWLCFSWSLWLLVWLFVGNDVLPELQLGAGVPLGVVRRPSYTRSVFGAAARPLLLPANHFSSLFLIFFFQHRQFIAFDPKVLRHDAFLLFDLHLELPNLLLLNLYSLRLSLADSRQGFAYLHLEVEVGVQLPYQGDLLRVLSLISL